MRTVSIFGSTGSVGCNTVDLIENCADVQVVCLSAGANVERLIEQARRVRPKCVVIADETRLEELQAALPDVTVMAGRNALLAAASRSVDWAMSALVGFAGVEVSLTIAQNGGVLALANKESLVCAGGLLKARCAQSGTTLIPVDSEHSALFQILAAEDGKAVSRLILTASGGPFRGFSLDQMCDVTPEQAMAHPQWDMGDRISIDSASMFNKAMEMIEAHELFDIPQDQIEVIIHPQSIIHSMVEFQDRAILAHLGPTHMIGPIGYALHWPDRQPLPLEPLDFANLGRLEFEAPDAQRFPAIDLARGAMRLGGLAGTVFNAAKEQALDLFLDQKIGFLDMAPLVEYALKACPSGPADRLEAIIQCDAETRAYVQESVNV